MKLSLMVRLNENSGLKASGERWGLRFAASPATRRVPSLAAGKVFADFAKPFRDDCLQTLEVADCLREEFDVLA